MKLVATVVEMFAGAGGAALGLRDAGFRSLAAIEMWDVAARTLRAVGFPAIEGRVEDPRVLADVARRVGSRRLDLLWASPPCQPYSSAGLRRGELDPRDGWGAVVLYVQRLRPRVVIVENVSDAPVGEWADAIKSVGGFEHSGSFHLRSTDFGDAQTRPRAFVYAGPSTEDAFLAEVARHRRPARSVADVLPHLSGAFVRNEQTTAKARSTAEPCPTLSTKGNLYVHTVDVGVRRVGYRRDPAVSRRATVAESAALQGFPADYPFAGDVAAKYKQIGNSVSPSVARALGAAALAVLASRART